MYQIIQNTPFGEVLIGEFQCQDTGTGDWRLHSAVGQQLDMYRDADMFLK